MKIINNVDTSEVRLDCVANGECFIYNNRIHLMTSEPYKEEGYTCVDLNNGDVIHLNVCQNVRPVNASIMINDIQ